MTKRKTTSRTALEDNIPTKRYCRANTPNSALKLVYSPVHSGGTGSNSSTIDSHRVMREVSKPLINSKASSKKPRLQENRERIFEDIDDSSIVQIEEDCPSSQTGKDYPSGEIDYTMYPLLLFEGKPIVLQPRVISKKEFLTPQEKKLFDEANVMINHEINKDALLHLSGVTRIQKINIITSYIKHLAAMKKEHIVVSSESVIDWLSSCKRTKGKQKGKHLLKEQMGHMSAAAGALHLIYVRYKHRPDIDNPNEAIRNLSEDERVQAIQFQSEYLGHETTRRYINSVVLQDSQSQSMDLYDDRDIDAKALQISWDDITKLMKNLFKETIETEEERNIMASESRSVIDNTLRKLETRRLQAFNGILEMLMGFYLFIKGLDKRNLDFGCLKFLSGHGKKPSGISFLLEHEKKGDATSMSETPVYRHKHPEVCLVGCMAMSFWYRFDFSSGVHKTRIPNFRKRERYYKKKILYNQNGNLDIPISTSYHTDVAKKALNAGGIAVRMVTDFGRHAGALLAERHGASLASIKAVMQKFYVTVAPQDIFHILAGFDYENNETYFIQREHCKPTEGLRQQIFPWLEEEKENLKLYYDENPGIPRNASSESFFEMMDNFRDVVLQDLTYYVDIYPECVFSKHPITQDGDFKKLKEAIDDLRLPDQMRNNWSNDTVQAMELQLESLIKEGFDQ